MRLRRMSTARVWFVLLLLCAAASSQQQQGSQELPSPQPEEQQQQLQQQPRSLEEEEDRQKPQQESQSHDGGQEGQQSLLRHNRQEVGEQGDQQEQPQENNEPQTPQPEPRPQEDGGHQESGDGALPPDLPPRQEQQQQRMQEEEELQRHPQEEVPLQQPQEEEEEGDEAPLPSDLPSLHEGQTAQLIKCCLPEEVYVYRPSGGPPACETVSSDQRWQPLLLNGRSGQRTPPDARSALVSGNVSCPGQHFWLNSADGDRFELLTTGHLYLRRSDALMAPLSFCADRLLIYPAEGDSAEPPQAGRVARVCTVSMNEARSLLDEEVLTPACARRTCLRKCCPNGLKLRLPDQLCLPQTGARPWKPRFWLDDGPAPDYHTVVGNPPCRSHDGTFRKVYDLQPARRDADSFFLKEDGRLWIPRENANVELKEFCVDQVQYLQPPDNPVDHLAIVCYPEGGDAAVVRVSVATYVYRALLLVSALFLLATLVVYCSVPELRNLHGRCLLSHVAALLTAYGCLLVAQLPPVYSNMAACQATALVMYFSFLAACFWLNVMSFDIWLTFSRIRSAAPNRSQTGRFIKYSLYCWCCPLVLTAVVITMQFVPDELAPPENFIRPRLGERNCWFPGSLEMLVYFHIPILVLMTANLGFFVLTTKNLLQTERDTRMAGRRKKGTERFKIYVNLFVVMGITWIAEALSMHIGPKDMWFVTDAFNALQGFFIFLLFTLRQNTRNAIRRRLADTALGRCCPAAVHAPSFSSRKTGSTSLASRESSRLPRHPREESGPERQDRAGTSGSPVRETAALCSNGAGSGTAQASEANGSPQGD